MALVFHFSDLENLGLVDMDSGDALIRVGDRLNGIFQMNGRLVQEIKCPPGLFVTEARPIGFGLDLSAPTRYLLLCILGDREQ